VVGGGAKGQDKSPRGLGNAPPRKDGKISFKGRFKGTVDEFSEGCARKN